MLCAIFESPDTERDSSMKAALSNSAASTRTRDIQSPRVMLIRFCQTYNVHRGRRCAFSSKAKSSRIPLGPSFFPLVSPIKLVDGHEIGRWKWVCEGTVPEVHLVPAEA
jgi:hypothetical protein